MTGARAKRIGLFLISERTGYQRLQADDGRRAAKAVGLPLDVFTADDTAAQQSAQIIRFLHEHPDEELGIVAMPVNDLGYEVPLRNLARRVLGRGVPWILLNRDVEAHVKEMRAEFPRLPIAQVAVDNREVGRIQARQVAAILRGRPGIMLYVLGNLATSAARDRHAALLEALPPSVHPHEVEGLWSSESAEKVVARWLGSSTAAGELAVIACQNDPMAVGARQALHRVGRDTGRPEWKEVPVLGVDGVPGEGRRLVEERVLAATVVMPPSAGTAIELLARAWSSAAPVPAKVLLRPTPHPA
jgi:ABC-type sugar transport system substrate-binding protein